jgi:hypothetical protein
MADNKTMILINDVNYDDNGNVTIEGYEPTDSMFDGDAAVTRVKITVDIEGGATFTLTDASNTNRVLQQKELFKLTDIPDVMEKKGWKVAAMLQREWFRREGFRLIGKSPESEKNPNSCHFTWRHNNMLSHEWLMSHPRMFTYLTYLRNNLMSPAAQRLIVNILKRNGVLTENSFNVHREKNWTCSDDAWETWKYHRQWQFQRQAIDIGYLEKAQRGFSKIDDLWAAFGGFSLFAALHSVRLYSPMQGYCSITLRDFYCYAADTYDFIDDWQYLGHWNKNGVQVSKWEAGMSEKFHNRDNTPAPENNISRTMHQLGEMYDLYFCVRNEHYNRYRERHGKGGDMIVWTGPTTYPLAEQEFTFHIGLGEFYDAK